MALIVEDGTIVAGAESYLAVTDADTYHSVRGNTAWAAIATTSLKEQALRRATDFMTGAYRTRWAGYRMSADQVLDWPRQSVKMEDVFILSGPAERPGYYETDVVPQEVKNACAELALKASAGALISDFGQLTKSVTVGPITKVYADASVPVQKYPAIDRMLAPLLKGGGGLTVVRC